MIADYTCHKQNRRTRGSTSVQDKIKKIIGGSSVGFTLEEFATIFNTAYKQLYSNKSQNNDNNEKNMIQLKICVDTAHIFVAGENIRTPEGIKSYLDRFEQLIGIRYITNFHLNDSRYAFGTRHNEHRGIGFGQIFNTDEGKLALHTIANFAFNNKIPSVRFISCKVPFTDDVLMDV